VVPWALHGRGLRLGRLVRRLHLRTQRRRQAQAQQEDARPGAHDEGQAGISDGVGEPRHREVVVRVREDGD